MNGFVFHIAAYCLLLLRVLKEHKGVLGVPISQSHLMTAYSKVPIIRTGTYASSAVHAMYCRTGPTYGTYNRNFRVWVKVI